MTIFARVIIAILLCAACATCSWADTTTVGVTLNGTTGAHIESDQAQAIPFLPLPMFELDHVHKQLRVHIEAMPPIGPVPLAQNGSLYGNNQNPRVSYLNAVLMYAPPNQPYALGIGETVINQRTLYPPSTIAQSSRVVGMRLLASAQLYQAENQRADASVAVNPGLQGLQLTTGAPLKPLAEYGSLFDASLRWTVNHGRYAFVYGVRYLNYTAAYHSNNSLADRNHLFMPFAGIDWPLQKQQQGTRVKAQGTTEPVADALPPEPPSTFELALLGTNGTRTESTSFAPTILPFDLVPVFSFTHAFKRFELSGQVVAPNESSNPYGSQQTWWSYVNLDALEHFRNAPFALGVGDTVINLAPAELNGSISQHARAEGLHLTLRATLLANLHGALLADALITPYVHVFNEETVTYGLPPVSHALTSFDHGARIEASLHHLSSVGRFRFDYGLRYVNQTTNYGPIVASRPHGGVLLTRSASLMPFAGLRVPF